VCVCVCCRLAGYVWIGNKIIMQMMAVDDRAGPAGVAELQPVVRPAARVVRTLLMHVVWVGDAGRSETTTEHLEYAVPRSIACMHAWSQRASRHHARTYGGSRCCVCTCMDPAVAPAGQ